MDPSSGEVVALVGSYDWSDQETGKINMAVVPRQPGSSFKPLVYATALEEKLITAGTILKDEKTDFGGGYSPKNFDGTFRGDVSIRRALAISLNIPAVEVMQKVGVNTMLSKARMLGITTLSRDRDYGLSLVLGSGEVPLIEMTNAYAAFAGEGELPERKIILEVRDKNKKTIYTNKSVSKKRVWDVGTAYIISSILSDSQARSEVFGTALDISRKAAVKTGTTDDNKDALTIGYTPQIVVGVWVGNSNNKPMSGVAGSLGAAPIWKSVMEQALSGRSVEWYKKPDSIEEVLICKEKGLRLPEDQKDATTSALIEYYIRGTEPKPEDMCIPQSPTLNPTEEAEKKKREDEERKKKDEENKKKNQPTAAPQSSSTPVATQPPVAEKEMPSPEPPTETGIASVEATVNSTSEASLKETP
jgi:membrane peptidoglycan carboxypeptidase